MPNLNTAEILLVEDNPADQQLFEEGVAQGCLPVSLHFAENGIEALEFLRRQGSFSDRPRPDVILLDLNLPKKDGREVLAEIQQDPGLSKFPVIIFSTSSRPDDVARAYQLGATSYLVKPSDLVQYLDLVQAVVAYCFRLAEDPKATPPRSC